mgnify:CR=1 FL=1
MNIRKIRTEDAEKFFEMCCQIDEETGFMMFEAGERRQRVRDLAALRQKINRAVLAVDLVLVAENDDKELVGFMSAQRGEYNRILHSAYIVVGIKKAYQGRGIGREFFALLDDWARENDIIRLELTVECKNVNAISLYERCGFKKEGLREKSMRVDGVFVDEYYMAKIIECR